MESKSFEAEKPRTALPLSLAGSKRAAVYRAQPALDDRIGDSGMLRASSGQRESKGLLSPIMEL
jgi:hypothetical protein